MKLGKKLPSGTPISVELRIIQIGTHVGEECMFSVIGNMDMQILLGVSFVSVFTAVLFESNKISVLLTHPIKGWNRILELPDCLWVQLGPSHQVVQVVYCTTLGCHLHCSPCELYC